MVTDFCVFYSAIRSIERTPTRDDEMSKKQSEGVPPKRSNSANP